MTSFATNDLRRTRPQRRPAAPLALALLVSVLLALAAGLAGGLLRAGVPMADWLGPAAVAHGALMVGGFMATLIGVERAVAVKRWWAWAVWGKLKGHLGQCLHLT